VNVTSAASGTPTIKYNNIYGNSTGQMRNGNSKAIGGNYLGDSASAGTLGGFDGAIVGSPFTRSTPGISTSNVYAATVNAGATDTTSFASGAVDITNGTGGSLDFVVVDLSTDTPFGLGTDPNQGSQCSNYYDVYIDSGGSSSTSLITFKVDVNSGACRTTYVDSRCDDIANGGPLRYVNSDSSVWQLTSSQSCDPTDNDRSYVQGSIAANLLGGTGLVVTGDNSPTAITLTNLTAASRSNLLPAALALALLTVLGGTMILARRRRMA
jgi:hypothetical protein